MIIGGVEYESMSDTVIVRVDYSISEMRKLNEIVNGLCSAHSWVAFTCKNTSEVEDRYENCEIDSITVYTEIEKDEYNLEAELFSNKAIRMVLDSADKCFKSHYCIDDKKVEKVEDDFVFDIEGDYSQYGEHKSENFPSCYQIKNSDLYGTTKFD